MIERLDYAEIWERKGRWLMGPSLLTDMILFLKDRGLEAKKDPGDSHMLMIALPLPQLQDEVWGPMGITIVHYVPEELRPIFIERCNLVLAERAPLVLPKIRENFIDRPTKMTPHSRMQINQFLREIEREIEARGEEPPLWHLAAFAFGFHPYALPEPAGFVS